MQSAYAEGIKSAALLELLPVRDRAIPNYRLLELPVRAQASPNYRQVKSSALLESLLLKFYQGPRRLRGQSDPRERSGRAALMFQWRSKHGEGQALALRDCGILHVARDRLCRFMRACKARLPATIEAWRGTGPHPVGAV